MSSSSLPSPQLSFESVFTRRYIIASYWIVVFLALPLWWTTTSIDRLSLPTSRVFAQRNRELVFPVHVELDTSRHNDARNLGVIIQQMQQSFNVHRGVQEASGIHVHVNSEPNIFGAYQAIVDGSVGGNIQGRRLILDAAFSNDDSSKEESVQHITDTLLTLLAPYTMLPNSQNHASRVVKYAPRYRLAFTLLNEDAASGVAAMTWDVRDAFAKHIAPITRKLTPLHNFTVESQVQYHAPLAFEPKTLQSERTTEYGLTQEDLTVFINSAEWILSSSVSNDPVLHFILFIPSQKHTPLHILGPDGLSSASSAFILPQWGGVVLYNPLASATTSHLSTSDLSIPFAIFRQQFMALLGVPPLSEHITSNDSMAFTDWQLDALLRRRAIENVKSSEETLRSIVSLVDQIENMPVGKNVQGDVQEALAALDQVYDVAAISPALALHYSATALTLSSRAFFNPGMLALLYFPAEHKYAVYTPLFASVAAPLVATLVREVLAWRRSRRASRIQGPAKDADPAERPKAE